MDNSSSSTQLCALQAQMETVISGLSEINTFMSTVLQTQTRLENRISDLEKLLGGHNTAVQQNKQEIRNLKIVLERVCRRQWSKEQALGILPVAVQLGMKEMTAEISVFLKAELNVDNCIKLFQMASEFELEILWESSLEVILDNFKTLLETSSEVYNLTFHELCIILFNDQLVSREEDVFHYISRWNQMDYTRRNLSSVLLVAVRYPHCNYRFLRSISEHYLVVDNTKVREEIEEVMNRIESGRSDALKDSRQEWRRRLNQDVLFVMGGWCASGDIVSVETTSLDTMAMIQYNIPQPPKGPILVTSIGKTIFVLELESKQVRLFEPATRKWKALKPMPWFSSYAWLAQEGNRIYVMQCQWCYYYDCSKDTWTNVASMLCRRQYASAAALNGKIYCSGGGNGSGETLSSMEAYSPKENLWSGCAAMLVHREFHSMVSCNGHLWALGGISEQGVWSDSAEKFDPTLGSWAIIKPMPAKRAFLTAIAFGGFIYAIGGASGYREAIEQIDVYDPSENKWTTSGSLITGRCYHHGSCVIQGLPCEEYSKIQEEEKADP